MQEPDVSDLLSVDRAIEILDSAPVAPRVVRVKLGEAQGLVLAQDVVADRDYPPFDKSLMDGYAVRAAEVSGDVASLRYIGEIAAGTHPVPGILAGETMSIMTGAPLPPGADAVVPVENLRGYVSMPDDLDGVELSGPATKGKFIAHRGSDCAAGQVVLRRGQRLESAQLAVAASVGAAEVDVFARPRVAILATGNEIVPYDRPPGPSQIRNCNSIMLASLLRRLGCDVSDRGMIADELDATRDAIARALDGHDVVFVTGGMSMGEYDFVPRALLALSVDLKITKLRIKPGKPFVFGVFREGRFVFGLPGNPVSGFACTLRLCSRLIARVAGATPRERWIHATLESDLPANGPREFYQPALLLDDGRLRALEWKSSGDVFILGQANCLLVRPENEPAVATGSAVKALEIPS